MWLEGWQLAAIEEYGYMDTHTGLINRVARHLVEHYIGEVSDEDFRNACYACKVDPDSFTPSDFEELQKKINQLI